MGDIYVRSTDGNDADNGSTWALAKATLAGAVAIASAGDRIFVSHVHDETTAAAITYNIPGTPNAPVQILCANDGAEPPTTLATTAIIKTTTGGNGRNIVFGTGSFYVYGLNIAPGYGSTSNYATIGLRNSGTAGFNAQTYEACNLTLPPFSSVNNNISIGLSANTTSSIKVNLIDCVFDYGNAAASAGINVANRVRFAECTWININTTAFKPLGNSGRSFDVQLDNCDLSAYGSGKNLVDVGALPTGDFILRNCKIGAAVSVTTGSFPAPGARVKLHNTDSADTQHALYDTGYTGIVALETTQVRTGGADDGLNPYSWRMTSSANCDALVAALETSEMVQWNDTVGSAITVTVEILHDSATALQDDEVWLEVGYYGTSGYPLGIAISDKRGSVLATPADQTSSSETWTTTGMTNPNTQKLSVTFTPQEVGYLQARVGLGKASYTLIVDPKLTVS